MQFAINRKTFLRNYDGQPLYFYDVRSFFRAILNILSKSQICQNLAPDAETQWELTSPELELSNECLDGICLRLLRATEDVSFVWKDWTRWDDELRCFVHVPTSRIDFLAARTTQVVRASLDAIEFLNLFFDDKESTVEFAQLLDKQVNKTSDARDNV